jgi:hypothetical protein
MNHLLALAINGHGGMHRWGQISRFRAAASITGAIWALKGKPGLPGDVVLDGGTRDQRLTITPFPRPGRYATREPYRQTIETARRAEPGPMDAADRSCALWHFLLRTACVAVIAAVSGTRSSEVSELTSRCRLQPWRDRPRRALTRPPLTRYSPPVRRTGQDSRQPGGRRDQAMKPRVLW